MRLAIGTITSNDFPVPNVFWESFIALFRRLESGLVNSALPSHRQLTSLNWIRGQQFPTDVARNEICAAALQDGCDYLLFLDCDMVHPSDLVERLLLVDQPVVTARYHLKKPPFAACVFMHDRVTPGPRQYRTIHFGRGVFEIHACGAGALLIRRDVLTAIAERKGHNWFRYQRGPTPPHDFSVSEDIWFCEQARAAGFSIWCDWELECGHVTNHIIGKSFNDAYVIRQANEMLAKTPEERRSIVARTIVRGIPEGIDYPSGDHVDEYPLTPPEVKDTTCHTTRTVN